MAQKVSDYEAKTIAAKRASDARAVRSDLCDRLKEVLLECSDDEMDLLAEDVLDLFTVHLPDDAKAMARFIKNSSEYEELEEKYEDLQADTKRFEAEREEMLRRLGIDKWEWERQTRHLG